MIGLDVRADLDRQPWSDLSGVVAQTEMGQVERVGLLRHATADGRAVVAMVVRLPDGTVVTAQTTLRLARAAIAVLGASPLVAEEV